MNKYNSVIEFDAKTETFVQHSKKHTGEDCTIKMQYFIRRLQYVLNSHYIKWAMRLTKRGLILKLWKYDEVISYDFEYNKCFEYWSVPSAFLLAYT